MASAQDPAKASSNKSTSKNSQSKSESSPKEKKEKTNIWLVVGAALGGIIAVGVTGYLLLFALKHIDGVTTDDTEETDESTEAQAEEEIQVERASSCEELESLMESAELEYDESSKEETFAEGYGDDAQPSVGSVEYSETNVQVEGIDEADIVKTDGEYIFFSGYDAVGIAKAYPAGQIKALASIQNEDITYYDLYIYEDSLVLLGTYWQDYYDVPLEEDAEEPSADSEDVSAGTDAEDSEEAGDEVQETFSATEAEIGVAPEWYSNTVIEVWDITKKAKPELKKGWIIEGLSSSTRLKDSDLYVVIQSYPYYIYAQEGAETGEMVLPEMKEYGGESEALCECTDVILPEDPWVRNYVQVVGLDLEDLEGGLSSEVAYGLGDIVYMSHDNIYIAGAQYEYPSYENSWWDPLGVWEESSYETKEWTVFAKFDYGDAEAEYLGAGRIEGSMLNQFSMDEYNGKLRVAVTHDRWESDSSSAVYILDEDMKVEGELEDLAEGEEIYAVRFMGDRGYVVTFETMDPLFVIDLSDTDSPEVLGELHIPGYSDYLHPWGEDYLIGFGMSTTSRYGWVETDGLKIAVFDVSDVENPEEVSKIEVGGSGSYSQILYDHKALLANQEEGWFAIPAYEYKSPSGIIEYGPDDENIWLPEEFQGLYVFSVDDEMNLSLDGRITHHKAADFNYEESGVADGWRRDVLRGAYIGEFIYAISDQKIGAYRRSNLELVKIVNWISGE